MSSMKDLYGDTPAPMYYPSVPGFREPTTSREAAARIAPDADTVRRMVLDQIKLLPSTADEVATMLGISILTVRPRMSELRKMRLVRPMMKAPGKQERRTNESGASAIVWEAGAEHETLR